MAANKIGAGQVTRKGKPLVNPSSAAKAGGFSGTMSTGVRGGAGTGSGRGMKNPTVQRGTGKSGRSGR